MARGDLGTHRRKRKQSHWSDPASPFVIRKVGYSKQECMSHMLTHVMRVLLMPTEDVSKPAENAHERA